MKILAVLMLMTQGVWAATVYKIGHELIAFHKVQNHWVDKTCKTEKCQALKMGKKFGNSSLAPQQLIGGKNPRSIRCKELMKGSVLIGRDREGNEQSFCSFPDGSFLR